MADSTATVHIVEDNKRIADMYGKWLESEYDAVVSYDGETALERIDSDTDLVFLDRDLPGKNGDDVLRELRESGNEIVATMLTATDPKVELATMECDDYLRKPVPEEKLMSRCERLLDRASMDEDVRRYLSMARRIELLEEKFTSRKLGDEEGYQQLRREAEKLHAAVEARLAEIDDAAIPDVDF